jgi:fructosamine-3-kinase
MHTGDEEMQFLENVLFEALGHSPKIIDTRLIAGGSINTTVRLATDEGTYFIKWSEAHSDELFQTEA